MKGLLGFFFFWGPETYSVFAFPASPPVLQTHHPAPAARGAHCTGCSVDRELKKMPLPKIIQRNLGFYRHKFLPTFRDIKGIKEINLVLLRSVTWNLQGEKMSEDGGNLLSHHVVPQRHIALAQSALSSEIKTKALLGASLRNLPFPQWSVFPTKCYQSSLDSLVKISLLES